MQLSDKLKAAILGFVAMITVTGSNAKIDAIIKKYNSGEIDEKQLITEISNEKHELMDDIDEELKKLGAMIEEESEEQKEQEVSGDPPEDFKDLEAELDELGVVVEEDDDLNEDEEESDLEDGMEDDDIEDDIEEDVKDNIEDDAEDDFEDDTEDDFEEDAEDGFGEDTEDDFGEDAEDSIEDVVEDDFEDAAEDNFEEDNLHEGEDHDDFDDEDTDVRNEPTTDIKKEMPEPDQKDDFGDNNDIGESTNSDPVNTEPPDRAEDRKEFQESFDKKEVDALKESDPEKYTRIMAANKMAAREEIDEAAGGETCWDNMTSKEMWDMYEKNPERAKMLQQDYLDRHPYGDCDFESPITKELIEANRAESKKQRDNNDGIPEDMLKSENPYQEFLKVEETDSHRL